MSGHLSYSLPLKQQTQMHERFEQAPIIREERASFGPPALIKLTRATSLAPK